MSAQPWFERGGVPSDARLEKDWTADDAHPAHKAAWAIYTERLVEQGREIDASHERQNDWYCTNNERTDGAS